MIESTKQFKKTPRRKAPSGKSIAVSAAAKQAYADIMAEKAAKEVAYGQHMPPDMKR